MELVKPKDTILRTPTIPVDFNNPPFDIIEFSKELVKFMYDKNGIGLSANQIGIPYSIFSMRGAPENFVCINPRIVDISNELVILEEGCLSYPNLIIKIKRPKHIRVRFNTPNGDIKTERYTGMTARVFQHEMQHIKGLPYWDGISRFHFNQGIRKSKVPNVSFKGA